MIVADKYLEEQKEKLKKELKINLGMDPNNKPAFQLDKDYSPLHMAADWKISIDELVSMLNTDKELKTLYERYLTVYKSNLWEYALDEKNFKLIDELLPDTGILDKYKENNSLQLSIVVDGKEIKF